jgi:signal transduction histidine kinase
VSRRGRPRKRRSAAKEIRDRLDEAEATLDAIRSGRVDAVVVSGPRGVRTLTIADGAHPYFVLLDAMNDGAALLAPNGEILFANRGLGSMTGTDADTLRGSTLQRMVIPADRDGVGPFLRDGGRHVTSREFLLSRDGEGATPVAIALSVISPATGDHVAGSDAHGGDAVLMAIITDLTYRKAAEATRARLLDRLIAAEDDERRRIARELHDEAGQSLTAIMVGLRAIADMGASADVRSAVLRLRDVTAHTVDDIGRLARGLHPAVLDDKGLAAAAKRYVTEFSQTFGVAVDMTTRRLDSPRLASMTAATMYRILQECLTNVGRHAHATRASVELKRDDRGIELVVRDDGIGFETDRTNDDRLGMRGMRERVALSRGSIEVESSPGHGAMVRVRLPIDRAIVRRRGDAAPRRPSVDRAMKP